ncbi:MAG TPA: PhoH family protein [Candidatus Eisenbacteria bacterium]|jgi:phosphate starvation-inducible PhoH-like protein|nr:PhoH family protein [Candidatus Eisenbacteria bacterium]
MTNPAKDETTRSVDIEGVDPLSLFGRNDANLRLVERSYPVHVTYREGKLAVKGDPAAVDEVSAILTTLSDLVRRGAVLEEHDVHNFIGLTDAGDREESRTLYERPVLFSFDKRTVRVKTLGQARYVAALQRHDIVFAIGPAGTGKTYLAVAAAVSALKSRQVERIVLVRPAVEAGESLGFLPGDMKEKVDPYLRPLYDALNDLLSYEKIRRFLDLGVIEVAPLAYMRGRTLNSAFVILDEAQNTTLGQMKMFLTRLGYGSKAVITGDVTQIDLGASMVSGLVEVQNILKGVHDLSFVYLNERDVVRHHLVREIIRAFEEHEENGREQKRGAEGG